MAQPQGEDKERYWERAIEQLQDLVQNKQEDEDNERPQEG